MREERRRVRDQEGSEKRDGRRPLTVRDVSLIRLARNGDLDSIKQMVKEGVNINEQDETGWTVLHEACLRNLPRMVDYLLRHGADPGIANMNGDTALHSAARSGCLRIVRALLYYNCDPLLSNHKGEKPLDLCHDPEVCSFLKQHTETNQSHMMSSSGSGKSSHLKVRQHHTHGTKHVISSLSGTTVSSSTEYHSGGVKDNSSVASPADVCSESEDDGHSHSGLSITTNISHHNISPITTATITATATNQQLDLICPSSTSQFNHATSSPSLLSLPKSITTDVHISSARSLKKDPYAFEDDENDETVKNSGNSLLHPTSAGATNSSNTNIQTAGHSINLNKSTSSNSTIVPTLTTTTAAAAAAATTATVGTTNTTTTTTIVNTNTNISPSSHNNIGSVAGVSVSGSSGSGGSLSKHACQLSSCNLSTIVECGNITLDNNNDNTLTPLTGGTTTTTSTSNSSGNHTPSQNNSVGGPPLRLRFAKEAGQYTLMEHQQQQQQQVDLPVSNCDTNVVLSSSGMSCPTIEASHPTVANVNRNNMICPMDMKHGDDDNNNHDNHNVSNEANDVSMMIKTEQTSSVLGGEELDHVSTSCHSESSGGEEMSKLKVPPLLINFASGTSVDESSSITSSCPPFGASCGGLTTHPPNNVESNANNEASISDRGEMKPHVSVDGVINVNNKSDGKEAGVTVSCAVSTVVTSIVSSSTSVHDKVGCSSVEDVGDGGNSISHSTGGTENVHDQYSGCHEKSFKVHGHAVASNIQHEESSIELSTCCTPPSSTCTTSPGTSTMSSVKTVEMSGIRSNGNNVGRVKVDTTQESNGCHGKSTNTATNNNNNNNNNSNNNSAANNNNNSNRETSKDTHRHRSGRTLRSHTAAQREKEEKERHADDTTPIKKRKLRSRSDAVTSNENSSHQNRSGGGGSGSGTANVNNPPTTTGQSGSSNGSFSSLSSLNPVVNMEVIEDTQGCSTVTVSSQIDSHFGDDENKVSVGNCQSTVLPDKDTTDVHMTCVSEMERRHSVSSSATSTVSTTGTTTTTTNHSQSMEVDVKPELCETPVSLVLLNMDVSNNVNLLTSSSGVGPTTSMTTVIVTGTTAPTPSSSSSVVEQTSGRNGDGDSDMNYLFCPAAPGDEDRKDIELLKFQNPYSKAAELNKNLREIINNLVKVYPKAPCGYQDYLLVTRNYLLANQLSLATYMRRSPPSHLDATFVELFNEQEEERYAQALKHQSEREHLQLGAEQAVLRAQTRGALAVANQSKPYSFCSILSYNDLTYIPPVGKLENREEESIRDRFTPRTFIGWLEDIIDRFQNEKKKLLCRQLHEAESLMMVQKLEWEMKTRETLASNIDCIGVVDIFKDIPASYVPLISVPNDFPLFAHDPVHRATATTTPTVPGLSSTTAMTMTSSSTTLIPVTSTTNITIQTTVNNGNLAA
ncbi:unnamed protein product, partial [Schistosoma turkestanicum]